MFQRVHCAGSPQRSSLARMLSLTVFLPIAILMCSRAFAAGGPLGIDHEWSLDQSGIWGQHQQDAVKYGAVAIEIGAALWLGNDNRLGHTFWQTLDSTAVASIATEALKLGFGRARPNQGNDPDQWFHGRCCDSFPSGTLAIEASFVTPIIVNYAHEHPWVWALEAVPLYGAIGRLKGQDHWQTDVLAGWALGTAAGYWATTRNTPLFVEILPRGFSVGWSKRF